MNDNDNNDQDQDQDVSAVSSSQQLFNEIMEDAEGMELGETPTMIIAAVEYLRKKEVYVAVTGNKNEEIVFLPHSIKPILLPLKDPDDHQVLLKDYLIQFVFSVDRNPSKFSFAASPACITFLPLPPVRNHFFACCSLSNLFPDYWTVLVEHRGSLGHITEMVARHTPLKVRTEWNLYCFKDGVFDLMQPFLPAAISFENIKGKFLNLTNFFFNQPFRKKQVLLQVHSSKISH